MNRIIKFRAWLTERKRMVIPTTIQWDRGKPYYISWEADDYGYNAEADSRFVLQYLTGIKDKNGKEVYEGDICKGTFGTKHGIISMTGSVFYDFNGFRLKVIKGDKKRERMVNYFDFIEDFAAPGEDIFRFEVIGNIYENKELLK